MPEIDYFSTFVDYKNSENFLQEYDITVNISMREACLGTTKHIRMNMESTCTDCNGTGAKNGTSFQVGWEI